MGTRFYKMDNIIVYEIANQGIFFNLWYTLNTLYLAKKDKFFHLTRPGFYSFGHVSFMHVKYKTSKYMKQLIVDFIFLIKEKNHISAKLSEGLYQTNRTKFIKSMEKPSTD